MKIRIEPYVLPVSRRLVSILGKEIKRAGISGTNGLVIVFRDTTYSPETGGYHPVEIAINSGRELLYITDLSYVGLPPMHELAKELDFDFRQNVFEAQGVIYPLYYGKVIFRIWQANFCTYYDMGVYNEIRITEDI